MNRERIEEAWKCLLVGALLLGVASAPGSAAELIFPPGPQGGGDGRFAIGDSLLVGARGLAPGAAADLRLRDSNGATVVELKLRADGEGGIPIDLLWRRSGVIGCDCNESAPLGPDRFTTFEDAERALTGTKWTVELVSGSDQTVLALQTLVLEPTRDFQAYVSGATGCPRGRMAPDEDIYLTFRGPKAPASARVFLVPDRPTWDEPLPLVEVRESVGPGGEVIEGDGRPLSTHLIWPGDPKSLRSGYFALVVRTDENDTALTVRPTDRVLGDFRPGRRKSVEAGVRINDWGCTAH